MGGGDCMRLCVSAAFAAPYEDTPEIFGGPGSGNAPEFQRAYEQWAAERGYRWWFSHDVAPVGLPRWFASVPALKGGGTHAVVMAQDRLWFDPSSLNPVAVAYESVALSDVLRALWLERSETRTISQAFLPIAGRPAGTGLRATRGDEPNSSVRLDVAPSTGVAERQR